MEADDDGEPNIAAVCDPLDDDCCDSERLEEDEDCDYEEEYDDDDDDENGVHRNRYNHQQEPAELVRQRLKQMYRIESVASLPAVCRRSVDTDCGSEVGLLGSDSALIVVNVRDKPPLPHRKRFLGAAKASKPNKSTSADTKEDGKGRRRHFLQGAWRMFRQQR